MRRIYFVLIYCTSVSGFAQGLSIELLVSWDSSKAWHDSLLLQQPTPIPRLVLTYRNLGPHDIYFRRITTTPFMTLPQDIVHNANLHFSDILERTPRALGESFKVEPNDSRYFGSIWRASRLPNANTQDLTDPVNYWISNFYLSLTFEDLLRRYSPGHTLAANVSDKITISIREALHLLSDAGKLNTQLEFKAGDFVGNEIGQYVLSQFIFLRKGEVLSETISLLPFSIVGGSYSFSLDRPLHNYVLGDSYFDEEEKCWRHKQIQLPARHDDFVLYHGDFLTNSVEVNFK